MVTAISKGRLSCLHAGMQALEVYQHALTIVPDSKELSTKIRTLSKLVKKDKTKADKAG